MDGERRHLEETLDLIASASASEALWRDVAVRMMDHTQADAGAIYVESRTLQPGLARPTEFAHLVNYENLWIERYFAHYATLNPYLVRPEFQDPGRLITENGLRGPLRISEQEFISDWQHPQGFRHVLAKFLHNREEGTLTLVFWRGRTTGSATEREQGAFDMLARAANRAVRMGDRLRRANDDVLTAAAVFNHLDAAVVILGRDGRVRGTSAPADRLLANQDGIVARGGRLEALYPQDQASLERLLADILDPVRCLAAEEREIRLRRSGGKPLLRVRAIAVHRRLPRFRADRSAAAVILLRAPAPNGIHPGELAALWDLTPAEARLAMLLLEPLSLAEAATRLGIGRETARSHLKALFAKTGTQRQAELVVRLLSTAP